MQNESFKTQFLTRLIKLSLSIIKFCEQLRLERNLRSIADQCIRSDTSIGANVVEAQGAPSRKDYTHYFQIAYKSANETLYWLILVRESGSKLSKKAETIYNEVIEVTKIIGKSIISLKKNSN